MTDERILELRKLGVDPDVSRMIAQVLQKNAVAGLADLPEPELDMLVEVARDVLGQLDTPTTPPPVDTSGWDHDFREDQ